MILQLDIIPSKVAVIRKVMEIFKSYMFEYVKAKEGHTYKVVLTEGIRQTLGHRPRLSHELNQVRDEGYHFESRRYQTRTYETHGGFHDPRERIGSKRKLRSPGFKSSKALMAETVFSSSIPK